MKRTSGVGVAAAALLALAGVASPARAQEDLLSKLHVHGYITQGLGTSTDNQLHGIPVDKLTADYRALALQLRFAATEKDAIVVQVGNRSLAQSPLSEGSEVKLKWAYYQRRLAGLDIRIGRTPYPKGIYNEIRDVGTLIPFFRAPYNTYTDGLETVDGAVVSRRFPLPGGFSAQVTALGGKSDYVQLSPNVQLHTVYVSRTRFGPLYGGQAWLNLPLRGVRLGGHGERVHLDNPRITGVNEPHVASDLAGYVDATFDKLFLRAETQLWQPGQYDYHSAYAHAGVQPLPRLWLNGQWEAVKVTLHPGVAVPVPSDLAGEFARDLAAGVKYDLSPMISLKVEGHRARGHQFDSATDMIVLSQNGLSIGPGLRTDYFLASISAAF